MAKWDVIIREAPPDMGDPAYDQRKAVRTITITIDGVDTVPEAAADALASPDLPTTTTSWTVMRVNEVIETTE